VKVIVVIGAGLTGLTLGYILKKRGIKDFIILEKSNVAGGLCKSIKYNGYTFDLTGHALHIQNSTVHDFIFNELKLKDRLNIINRKASILYKNKLIPYPFQKNLYYLPPEDKKKCFIDYLKTQYLFKSNKNTINLEKLSFDGYIRKQLGDSIVDFFIKPYNEKLWCIKIEDLTTTWLGRFFPKVTAEEIVDSTLKKGEEGKSYNSNFYYPSSGGINTLISAITPHLKKYILYNKEVSYISANKKLIFTKSGEKYSYDVIVNTAPLKNLSHICHDFDQETMKLFYRAQKELKANTVNAFFIGLKKINEKYKSHTWLYLPEKKYTPYRFGIFNNFSENLTPVNRISIYVEVANLNGSDLNKLSKKDLTAILKEIGIINSISDIDCFLNCNIYPAYCIFDKARDEIVSKLIKRFSYYSIFSIGRYGGWKYASMGDCIYDAIKIGNKLTNNLKNK